MKQRPPIPSTTARDNALYGSVPVDGGCTKRQFMSLAAKAVGMAWAAPFFAPPCRAHAQSTGRLPAGPKAAAYVRPLPGGAVACMLCPRGCRIAPGERGRCGVRENQGGRLYTLVYGNACAVHPDPIEKKPFLHVLPATTSLSVATAGCNLHCKFCQNWELSQALPEEVHNHDMPPERIVKKAVAMGARSITFSYTEPAIFYEYMREIAAHAKKINLPVLLHSNGFMNRKPLEELCPFLDGAQIDLKGFSESFYRELCDGRLEPVLKTIKTMKRSGIHLEITNLLIPTKNDASEMITDMCRWIMDEVGPETPLHFSRFYPLYQLKRLPPTPLSTLQRARDLALSAGLSYVYIGNVPGHEAWNTFCPRCEKMIIERIGYMIKDNRVIEGKCQYCGKPIAGIWV